ncbi:inorganic phosphate transporter [Verrucomicrobiota bacterium]
MEPVTIIVLITAIVGFYMAWNIGANDVANSMADAVGSKAISVKKAVIAAGLCEFAGAVLVGSHVTDTVRKGIVDPNAIAAIPGMTEGDAAVIMVLGMASALLAAAVWLNAATWIGMPVSTTHSIVGAVAGFGIVAAGWSVVNWGKMGQIVASWLISPVAGGIMAFIIFKIINWTILGRKKPVSAAIKVSPYLVFAIAIVITLSILYKGMKHIFAAGKMEFLTGNNSFIVAGIIGVIAAVISRIIIGRHLRDKVDLELSAQLRLVEQVFAPLVVVTSCSVAFAHGANDVANSVGPLAAVVDIVSTGTIKMKVAVPTWVLTLGGFGIVMGLATYGYRVMHTVGTKITEITPSRGVAADIAATITVLICTRMKLPISTTHTLVGAIMGIGLARGLAGINRKVARSIFGAWFITVPVAAILAIIFFLLGKIFLLDFIKEAIS